MLRRGAAHGLDTDDYLHEDQCLEILHRPETDNPIKNGKIGERLVALSGDFCNLPDNYLRDRRHNVEDDNGRRPFITLTRASLGRATIGRDCFRFTTSCEYANDCAHHRDPDYCEAVNTRKWGACPSSLSPHPFRRVGLVTDEWSEVGTSPTGFEPKPEGPARYFAPARAASGRLQIPQKALFAPHVRSSQNSEPDGI